ncbi:MAG TPA: putative Ig domain-containing protein [Candidatus Baltobacteraceae bacterium]|nr:putative Ig domain-containing protein [Candidatus Baltobacteraceae bacterium]
MRRVQRTYIAALFLVCFAAAALAGCGGSGVTIVIELQPSGPQTVDEGGIINYTAIVGGDTKNGGVTWKLTGTNCGGTPATGCGTLTNLTSTSVTYTAPTGISASITATLTATAVDRASITQTSTITVELAPTFSAPCVSTAATCPLAGGANGVQYSQTITITGGVAPYTYSVISGSLPACLTLNGLASGTTDTIVGTPCGTTLQTSTFTIQVKDNGNAPASEQTVITQTYSITIQPPPPLSITTTSLPQGFTNVQYNSALTAHGGVLPLTWTLVGGGDTVAPGLTLTTAGQNAGQIAGVPTTTGTFSFQVTVKDSSLPNPPAQTAGPQTISITISKPPVLSITTGSLASGTVAAGYSASIQATGGAAPYTWTLTQGQLPSGLALTTTDSTGKITGIPVLAGTSTFTVEVTDSEVVPVTKTASFSITIAAGTTGGDSLFNGQYTFLFQGFDTGGTVAEVGTLTANGSGFISSGSEDSNRYSATSKTIEISNNISIVPGATSNGTTTGSTYSIGTDGRGTLELEIVNGQGTTVTTDYELVMDSNGNIHFFENDATGTNNDAFETHGEGVMKPAPMATSSSFIGNYAFELSGVDSSGKKDALAGVFNSDGAHITPGGSGPNTDLNDAGTFSSQNASGSVAAVGSGSNRGGASFILEPAGKAQTTLTFIFYFVSSNDLYFMEDDSSTTTFPNPPRLSGEVILQNPDTVFNSAVMDGTSVATGTGVDGSNASILGGLLTSTLCDGSAAVSLAADENDAGTLTTSEALSGTCTVTTTGRATFTLSGGSGATRLANAYLIGPGSGFFLGSDAAVTTGMLEQQSGSPFADSSVVGGYTLTGPFPGATNVPNVVGQVTADGAGDITGTVDAVLPPGKPAFLDQSLAATVNSLTAAGRSPVTTNAPTGFPTNLILYMVSPSSVRAISADSGVTTPQVFLLDH